MLDKTKLTIGSDPEFALYQGIEGGLNFIDAGVTFNGEDENCDHDELLEAEFGTDGNSSTMEIRPEPANDPIEHADNIKRLLRQAKKEHPVFFNYIFKSLSTDVPLGGHIHLGHPKFKKERDSMEERGSRLELLTAITQNLDVLLAIPVMFLETRDKAIWRKGSYGNLGDIRYQNYGGYEYRTLPSWLSTERISKAVLSTAFIIAKDTLEARFTLPEELRLSGLTGFKDAFRNQETRLLRPHLLAIFKTTRRLSQFKKYQPFIEYLFGSSRQGRPLLEIDIRSGWGFKITRNTISLLNLISYYQRAVNTAFKLTDLFLTTSIQTHAINKWGGHKDLNSYSFQRFNSYSNDYAIELLARSTDTALILSSKKLFKSNTLFLSNPVRLYGVNSKRPQDILIGVSVQSTPATKRRLKRFGQIARDLALKEEHLKEFNFCFEYSYDANKLGFGFRLRKYHFGFCQSLSILFTLLANPHLWRSTTNKKTTRIIVNDLRKSYRGMKKNSRPYHHPLGRYYLEKFSTGTLNKFIDIHLKQMLLAFHIDTLEEFRSRDRTPTRSWCKLARKPSYKWLACVDPFGLQLILGGCECSREHNLVYYMNPPPVLLPQTRELCNYCKAILLRGQIIKGNR